MHSRHRTRPPCGGSSARRSRRCSSSRPTSRARSTRRSTDGTTRRGSGPGCSATTRTARTWSCGRSSRAMAAPGCTRRRGSVSRHRRRVRTRRGERPDSCMVCSCAWSGFLAYWAASHNLVELLKMPAAPGLEGSTLRQVIHISVGGSTVRVHFSNTFGTGPFTITSAHIARSRGRSAIDLTTDRPLTFAGADSVRIAPGAMAISDLLEYDVPALSDLAVAMLIGAAPADVTGHPGSRTTSFLQAGQLVSAAELPDAATTDHWYVIAGLDVVADGAAVGTLGNSITDGRGSGTDRNDRWPDNLARRLQSDP